MIGLDTAVLVRFLTQDDPEQGHLASRAMAQLTQDRPGLICREVLIELVWVLERSYKYRRSEISAVVSGLLATSDLFVEGADLVAESLSLYEYEGFGFADLMIRAASRRLGAATVLTFDRKTAALEGVMVVGEDGLLEPWTRGVAEADVQTRTRLGDTFPDRGGYGLHHRVFVALRCHRGSSVQAGN